MAELLDPFQRKIGYLRISVTDRCNLRCLYCVPPQGISLTPKEEILRYEEILEVVRAAAALGIGRVRITGGEPLVRTGLVDFVAMLSQVEGVEEVSMTTNGLLLARHAQALQRAGLNRVNVSLDSLRPERFQRITRYGRLEEVLEGIQVAREVGLSPLKLNVVVMRGLNDDELADFALTTLEQDWLVRFIEPMPLGDDHASACGVEGMGQDFLPVSEMRERLSSLGELEPCTDVVGNGPAHYLRLPGAKGALGFISPLSESFCRGCNRLRLTAEGKLRPCLLSEDAVDLRAPLRSGVRGEPLQSLIRLAVSIKPERHRLAEGIVPQRRMAQIGG